MTKVAVPFRLWAAFRRVKRLQGIPFIRANPPDGSALDGLFTGPVSSPIPDAFAPKRNGGLSALPRPSPVICGYWTKAIALPRVPKHLHFRILPLSDRSHGNTRLSGILGDRLSRSNGRIPILRIGSRVALQVKVQ
jgi:hypothetical protein